MFKPLLSLQKWLTCRPLNNHECIVFCHMYSCIHYSKWREQNQFHAWGCFHETILFLTCSVPPWALHLEDCTISPFWGRPGTEWGARAPRGLARPWTGTASPPSSRWSRSEDGDWGKVSLRQDTNTTVRLKWLWWDIQMLLTLKSENVRTQYVASSTVSNRVTWMRP